MMCAPGHVCVLTKDNILNLELNRSECSNVKCFLLETAKGDKIYNFCILY